MSCVNIVETHLRQIEKRKNLNAFLDVFAVEALESARGVDARIAAKTVGPLAGMVVAVKDGICVRGKRTTCGSNMLKEYQSPYDATIIKRLRAADAILIGKTNMDEFAMGSSTENSAFGAVRHPIDETRVPGGSSGGSAVAVATGMALTSLGSDTGGSIRQPAAFCGVVGLKPTYGRVSRYGLVAFASSFDQIGPMGSTVRDVASVLEVIAGHDPSDATSAKIPVAPFTKMLSEGIKGLRVGLPKEYFAEGLDDGIRQAIMEKVEVLKEHGAIVTEVSLPHTEYTIATYYILSTAEASSNLARYDGARYGHRSDRVQNLAEMYTKSRTEGFGAEVKRRIMLGTYVLSAGYYDAYYRKGQQVRRRIKNDFDTAFESVDCLITPTAPTTAFRMNEKIDDPMKMYLSDVYTVSANLAGIPGLSIPCGKDTSGMPIGLQILGRQFDEQTILRVGEFLERSS